MVTMAPDPWILWMLRAFFFACSVFILWALYARRGMIETALVVGFRALHPAWVMMAPLFTSRSVIGGVIMFCTLIWRVSLPPETVDAFTTIICVISGVFGIVINIIGRAFAKGPLVLTIPNKPEVVERARETPEGDVVLERTVVSNHPAESSNPATNATPEAAQELASFVGYRMSDSQRSAQNVPEWEYDRGVRQGAVSSWAIEAFGAEEATSLPQRGLRLVEEALEAAQACGSSATQIRKLVTYVYSRPVGELPQEIGGVSVTLLALSAAAGQDADLCEKVEVKRILSKPIRHFTARNNQKNAAGFKAATAAPKTKVRSRG